VAAACSLGASASPGGATAQAAGSLPAAPAGARPGPAVLYAPPAAAPELENTGIWHAPPILISGASAYRDGEFLYQDYLYDDHGARGQPDPGDRLRAVSALSQPYGTLTYPTDPAYAGNAADLVELRVKPLADATAFRLTLNTMTDPSLVAATIAIGDSAVPLPLPHGANVSAPAQLFLTWHGTTADLLDAATGAPAPLAPSVSVDVGRHQVEIRVPHADWDPGDGTVRLAAGVGLWDAQNGSYLAPQASADATHPGGAAPGAAPPALFNVAFRYDEPLHPGVDKLSDPAMWRDNAQGHALAGGDISSFAAYVDFAKLHSGTDDPMLGRPAGTPVAGVIDRIMPSALATGRGVDPGVVCSGALVQAARCTGQFLGRLQPYAVYIPSKPPPPGGYGLTLLLHSFTENYNEFSGMRYQSQLGDAGRGSIVVTPEARGPDGFYYSYAEADVFEAWADLARHYELDPDHTVIAGYSMGAVGVWRIAGQFPDLFARAQPTTSGPNNTQVPSFRNLPLLVWLAGQDELQTQNLFLPTATQLDSLGYAYEADYFEPADHLTLHFNDQWAPAAAFLAHNLVNRDPPHVTLDYNPAVDFPDLGIVGDHAYWLSGVGVRTPSQAGSTVANGGGSFGVGAIDVRSEGFGLGDPAATTTSGAGVLNGGDIGPLPFASHATTQGPAPRTPVANRLDVSATNVSAVTIDAARARVSCDPAMNVATDGPLTVRFIHCPGGAAAAPQVFGDDASGRGAGTGSFGLPSSHRCASRRAFRIHVRAPRGYRLVDVRVRLGRSSVRTVPGHGRRALVDLRGLPGGLVRVTVVARTPHGRRLVRVRRYRTCVARRAAPRYQ